MGRDTVKYHRISTDPARDEAMAQTDLADQTLREELQALLEENELLKEQLESLRASTMAQGDAQALAERHQLLLDATHVGTWDWDPVDDVAQWNNYAYAMFGLRPEEAPASFATAAERVHPDDLAGLRMALFRQLERGERFALDVRALQADGTYRWVHATGRALRNEQGKARRVIGLILDIHERKSAEVGALGQAKDKSKQLELARQELEEFCYAVSHDLRSPLRSINGFAKALESDYSGKLDDPGRDYLARIQKASVVLADLLDSLLGMVRIGRVEMFPERVDVTEMARALCRELQDADPHRKVIVKVQDGLVASADARLFRLMMTNLISNAWKFTLNVPNAEIEVACEKGIFHVKDNGAGFDMKYSDKLYKPFQKLHSSARFPGTGIGLAIAQRIAARHGGALWAHSAGEGLGAAFSFRLGEPRV